jgi:CRP/FNR family transcriptional activator FtrB
MQTALHSHSTVDILDQPPSAEDRRRLRRFPALAEAGDATVQTLLGQTPITVVPKHEAVVREGIVPTGLVAVITGRLSLVTQMPGEQPAVLAMVGRGEFLMPSAAIAGSAYPLTARAVEETRIASIPLGAIRSAVEQDPGFCSQLARLAGGEWMTLLAQFKDYRLRSAPQRFASYLVNLAQAGGRAQNGGAELELPDDRKTLASLLGMTPENLSRTIAQFRERGVVITGRLVSIADLAGLAAFAGIRLAAS